MKQTCSPDNVEIELMPSSYVIEYGNGDTDTNYTAANRSPPILANVLVKRLPVTPTSVRVTSTPSFLHQRNNLPDGRPFLFNRKMALLQTEDNKATASEMRPRVPSAEHRGASRLVRGQLRPWARRITRTRAYARLISAPVSVGT